MVAREVECDIKRIRCAVAEFVARAGFDWDGLKAGRTAVPLADLVDGHPLCLVEVRRLTPASVSRHLAKRGLVAPVAGERPGRALAGFVYGDCSRAFIFLNRDDPFARRRFSLAHEIGHFMLHGGGGLARATARPGPVQVDDEPEDPREVEAHAFAAELLMPWELVEHDAAPLRRGEIGPERAVTRLATRLQVSRQAAARRLREWPGGA